MFKSPQKYYNLQDFKIDVDFNKNINIIFRKKFLEKDKINLTGKKSPTSIGGAMNCLFF